jgi:hypothetical protein
MSKQILIYLSLAVLFVFSFLVLNWIYGYVITVQSGTNDCFFMFGRPFLLDFFGRPGDPLRYAGRFLGQFYYHRWLGALIVSASITCFGVLFYRVLAKLKRKVHLFQTLVPCAFLLALHTSTVWLIHDTLGLCTGCALFLGYLSFRPGLSTRVYAWVATPVIYFFVGVYAWFFVAWIAAFEWLGGPLRWRLFEKTAYVAFSLAVPLAAWCWVFPISLPGALLWPLMSVAPLRGGALYCTLINSVTDCILGVALFASIFLIPIWGRVPWGVRLAVLWRTRRRRWNRLVPHIAVAVLAVLFLAFRYDPSLSTLVTCRQLYKHRQWDVLLEEAKKHPSPGLELQFMTNFALYKKRRLLDEMFRYPQAWGTRGLILNFSGLAQLSPAEDDTYRAMYNSDLFYEMGHTNLAFRHVYNSMYAWGETYDILKRMAQCSLVNGNYATAAKYLNMLEGTLFHNEFARRLKATIADPAAADKEFGGLRKRFPVVDVSIRQHPLLHLAALLVDKDNPMALDYLTAWLLLEKTKDSIFTISQNIGQLRRAGYDTIPTHCQEVLLLWESQEGTTVDLHGFRYDEAITARVDDFLRDLSRYGDRQEARQRLRALYGDTYMFYCFFVPTPAEVGRIAPASDDSGDTVRQE